MNVGVTLLVVNKERSAEEMGNILLYRPPHSLLHNINFTAVARASSASEYGIANPSPLPLSGVLVVATTGIEDLHSMVGHSGTLGDNSLGCESTIVTIITI